jgi:carboxymethylenebutenolidase
MARTVVAIKTEDGECPTSVFTPEGKGPWPGVVVFMDALGPRPSFFDIGERIAAHGYLVLLPDFFYRAGPYEPPTPQTFFTTPGFRQEWFDKYVSTASQANVRKDTGAVLDYLASRSDIAQPKVGTVGFCWGGGMALSMAGFYPERVAAAASYHGGRLATEQPESPHLLAPKMKARVYVAGAVEDPSFPDDMKQRLIDAFAEAHVNATVETYPARHGWVPADMPVHDATCAERAYATLFALFDEALKGAGASR